jgi:Tetracyclin repressor-like, C-terminal domain
MPAPPNTGDVGADLLGYLEKALGVFQRGAGFAMLGALLVKERDDPELMALFRARVVRPRMQVIIQVLERGVVADQMRQDVDAELTAHMLAGALFAAHVSGRRIDAGWLQRVVNSLLEGLRPARRGR